MLSKLLHACTNTFTPVVDSVLVQEEYYAIDMSSSNKNLTMDLLANQSLHHEYLQDILKQNNAKVAHGGYLEHRSLYDRSDYFQAHDDKDKRNIHLGVDLWCPTNTSVLSPLNGKVHSFQNNKNFGDYGPTLILEHKISGFVFYTLYGHLSEASLENKFVGQNIKSGEVIAALGSSEVNGEYAPHLHFQIIVDMQGESGDYPGVCSRNTLGYYRENCPDPNLILKIV